MFQHTHIHRASHNRDLLTFIRCFSLNPSIYITQNNPTPFLIQPFSCKCPVSPNNHSHLVLLYKQSKYKTLYIYSILFFIICLFYSITTFPNLKLPTSTCICFVSPHHRRSFLLYSKIYIKVITVKISYRGVRKPTMMEKCKYSNTSSCGHKIHTVNWKCSFSFQFKHVIKPI